MKVRPRTLIWVALLALAVVGIVRAFQPTPVIVDVAAVRRGALVVTVDDDGRTRVRERYVVHAPIRGQLVRTLLDPGDPVRAGATVVAEFDPVAPSLLDDRSRAEAEARLERALAAVDESRARREQADADAAYAKAELDRVAALVERGIASPDDLEAAERDARAKREALRAAEFLIRVAQFEAEIATATLSEPEAPLRNGQDENSPPPPRRMSLRSPIDGAVLRVFEESARPLEAGAPILELGDVRSLEIVADYLSQDAVRVRPGMPARLVGWGGENFAGQPIALEARVRVVEPSGFTKISALGVEEQRVDIVLDPVGDPASWAALGDGYRVDVLIETWRGDDLLLVATGALFRQGEDWAAFVAKDGVARPRAVQIGRRTGLEAEVLEGLAAGEEVVLYPSALVGDGTPVELR